MDSRDWNMYCGTLTGNEVDLEIDKITPCLIDRLTKERVHTHVKVVTEPIPAAQYIGWSFDWSLTQRNGYTIYRLVAENDPRTQGMISLQVHPGYVHVDIVESAPHNRGDNRQFYGTGAHLFAIACKLSFDNGCDGFVDFVSKSNLVEYYVEKIGAKILQGNHLYIDTIAAQNLVDQYFNQ